MFKKILLIHAAIVMAMASVQVVFAFPDRRVPLVELKQVLMEAKLGEDCQIIAVRYSARKSQLSVDVFQKSTGAKMMLDFFDEGYWTHESSIEPTSPYWIWNDRIFGVRKFPWLSRTQLKDYVSLHYDSHGRLMDFEASLFRYEQSLFGKWYWTRIKQIKCEY